MFDKKKTQPTKYKTFENDIKYVIKSGNNGVATKPSACKNIEDINNASFDRSCNIIELYRQDSEFPYEKTVEINENALVFKIRLFDGDFIPTLQALQLPCEKTSVSIEFKDEYNKLVSRLVESNASGIISVNGHPYMARLKDTYAFELDANGKVKKIFSLDSLFISAERKYQAILDGNSYVDANYSKITGQSSQPLDKLIDILKK